MKKWFIAALTIVSLGAAGKVALAQVQDIIFPLSPNPKFVSCLGEPGGPTPTAEILVQRGEQNDVLILHAEHLRPNLKFDLFTVQNTSLLSNGTPDPSFANFGLAWYQTDVQANSEGNAESIIKTILLDQIFGFDQATGLIPTHTFHVGFWFNNPQDAVACGFDPTKPTPFNGEQHAGPLAMISVPSSTTKLGPLCTSARKVGTTFVCSQ